MRTLYTKCPLCGTDKFNTIKKEYCHTHPLYHPSLGDIIDWKQCAKCTHVFTEGYFEGEAEKLLFNKVSEPQTVGFETERQRNVSGRIIDKVLPYANKGRWLDVGFGNGSLLFTAKEYGFIPIGLDLREQNVALMNGCGISAINCTIEEIADGSFTGTREKSCYSAISMCDVLEHMPFPKRALSAASKLLRTNGILFISCPNMDSIVWQLLPDNENPYWGEIEHYHNFGRKRLYELLSEFKLEPVRYSISERYRIGMEIIAQKVPY